MKLSTFVTIVIFVALVGDEIGFASRKIKRFRQNLRFHNKHGHPRNAKAKRQRLHLPHGEGTYHRTGSSDGLPANTHRGNEATTGSGSSGSSSTNMLHGNGAVMGGGGKLMGAVMVTAMGAEAVNSLTGAATGIAETVILNRGSGEEVDGQNAGMVSEREYVLWLD
ncbi:uncharacterized protein LOC119374928 [Rhipicephalus sanguineus]|uniref:uncharacterized protein LOC119374928 n=1 Tax=Rhipicephalus sanguineus TaxID=34632 RepID=UPI00189555A7|nr:uncharacterized protein LOC119374928 [Rhipicephalus sanguineus]